MNPKFHKFMNAAESELKKVKILDQIGELTKVPRVYVATGVALFALLLAYVTLSVKFLVSVFAVAYPTYATYLAMDSENKAGAKQVMAYWVIYGMINVFESTPWKPADFIPAYQTLKILLLLFLFMPKYNGSVIIYDRFLKGFLGKSVPCIEKAIGNFKKSFKDAPTTPLCASGHCSKSPKNKGFKNSSD